MPLGYSGLGVGGGGAEPASKFLNFQSDTRGAVNQRIFRSLTFYKLINYQRYYMPWCAQDWGSRGRNFLISPN